MVEISKSGSGEGPGWETGPGYSTGFGDAGFYPFSRRGEAAVGPVAFVGQSVHRFVAFVWQEDGGRLGFIHDGPIGPG